ncbi:hypothetical protein [Duganella sp. BJB475]|uniref:hypothetical protein n=1 Tax=Duganella sp. BJB475 TaxID=2233914 RepID=UPI0011C1506E|nr:hypothetical protein [Duganella sp. BJB475]
MDNFKPALKAEHLREIGLRRDAADIIMLLWEIKRLRALVMRADQVVQRISGGDYLVETFRAELRGEPVLEEMERRRAAVDLQAKPPGYDRRQGE